jgi:elongation factor 1-beta
LKSGWLSIYDFGFLLVTISGGKSSVLLDVKPWDDETDMKKLEEAVRSVQLEGLFWGACMLFSTSHFLIIFCLLFIFAHLNIVDCFNII